jgi:hypothetical protein
MTDEELNRNFEQLRVALQRVSERVDERFEETIEFARGIETNLLKEFRKWAISFESRHKANEILVGGFNERLIALEERVGDLERNADGRRGSARQ